MIDMRKDFEKWYSKEMLHGYDADDMETIFYVTEQGYYQNRDVQSAWRGYYAALQSKVEPAPSNMDMRSAFEAWVNEDFEKPITLERDCEGYADGYLDSAWDGFKAALSHTSPALVATPEGWQLVPIEPTDKMAEALMVVHTEIPCPDMCKIAYRRMLEVVPAPTQEQRGEDQNA